ncbi:MAG: hypothetical protein R3F55_07820 [Alphaproteobacteria bacterium]
MGRFLGFAGLVAAAAAAAALAAGDGRAASYALCTGDAPATAGPALEDWLALPLAGAPVRLMVNDPVTRSGTGTLSIVKNRSGGYTVSLAITAGGTMPNLLGTRQSNSVTVEGIADGALLVVPDSVVFWHQDGRIAFATVATQAAVDCFYGSADLP